MSELTDLIKQRNEIDAKIRKLKNINHGKVWIFVDRNRRHANTGGKYVLKIQTISEMRRNEKREKIIIESGSTERFKSYIKDLQNDLKEVLQCFEELEELS